MLAHSSFFDELPVTNHFPFPRAKKRAKVSATVGSG